MHEPSSCKTAQTSNAKELSWNDWWSRQCWFYYLKRAFFLSGGFVVYLWRQRSSDQDDHKGKKPYNETSTELLLIGCLTESIWTPRSKSNTLTPKTNSQTYWQREISHVMNGIIFLCLFNISHFSSTHCLEVISKRTQEENGEERVIANLKPMMHLVSRSQIPLSSWNVQQTGAARPIMLASSSNSSEWNIDEKWSSQEWKSCEMLEAKNGETCGWQVVIDDDMDSGTATESNLSLKSRSFLHRVNDRLRKILDHSSKDAMKDIDKRFFSLGNVYFFNAGSICIHGKGLLRKFTFHRKYREWSHFETDVWHSWKVDSRTIRWDFWSVSNQLGRFSMETVIFAQWWRSHQSLACKGLCIFRFCVMSNQNPTSNTVWEEKVISLHSITNSGLIPGGQNSSRERQTVFFTAVNLMDKDHKDPYKLDLTKPRLAWYKQKTWKRHQDTVYWVEKQLAQREGFKFYQSRCNASILYDTLPAYCISKVFVMESGEVMYEKVFVSPRPPPTTSFKDSWMKDLDSEIVGSSKDTQRIQPKPKTPIIKNGKTRGWTTVHPGDRKKMSCLVAKVPVDGQQSTQLEETDIDFRVPGLSHAVVKEAENFRVQELVKKIESHPHREALQADLQNNVYNPFSNNFEGDDPWIGQCRVIRVVRNNTGSATPPMSSLLESRNCLLHLRIVLGWKRIQKKG